MTASRVVYRPIKRYQTRVLLLHGDNDDPDSQLVCDLHTADILHAKFHLGLHSHADEEDYEVQYDALSYAWGSGENTKSITCNGVELAVTENLFQALKALRYANDSARYLWIDAICINQSDDLEKSNQVSNMLLIYQKAHQVVVWLGAAHENLCDVLKAAALLDESLLVRVIKFVQVVSGMEDLYCRPWFRRMWVQQEIYAAQELKIRCGNHEFRWPKLLSEPDLLLRLPHLQSYSFLAEQVCEKPGMKTSHEIMSQGNQVCRLKQTHALNLNCFERFSNSYQSRPDFVETLLYTGTLNATNPKDYIYAIVGMTEFPARPMSIAEWIQIRKQEIVIPIDYSADTTSILCAVTWTLVMIRGLSIITTFKAFDTSDDGSSGPNLPSWVIDWRLAAKVFELSLINPVLQSVGTRYVWNTRQVLDEFRMSRRSESMSNAYSRLMTNICVGLDPTKLILYGTVVTRYYAKDQCVWERRRIWKDRLAWCLKVDVYPTDLIVRMDDLDGLRPFGRTELDEGAGRDLWLLRPTDCGCYRFFACLLWLTKERRERYDHWRGKTNTTASVQDTQMVGIRPLAVDPTNTDYTYCELTKDDVDHREFVIV